MYDAPGCNGYKDEADLTAQIHGFAKRFAPMGVHRVVIKVNKVNQYSQCLEEIRSRPMFSEYSL